MDNDIIGTELQRYNITDEAIARMSDRYMQLAINGIDDRPGQLIVHEARMVVKNKRVEVEKVRKALKEDSLRFGRAVDGEAKRITALLAPIEAHLEGEEDRIAAIKAAIKAEEDRKAREIEEARLKAIEEARLAEIERQAAAERERIAAIDAEQAAERERLAVIAKKQADDERVLREERESFEAEKRAIAEEKRLAQEAALRAAEAEQAKADAAEQALRDADLERERLLRLERERISEEDLAKQNRTDNEKMEALAQSILAIGFPFVTADYAVTTVECVRTNLAKTAVLIRSVIEQNGGR